MTVSSMRARTTPFLKIFIFQLELTFNITLCWFQAYGIEVRHLCNL